MLQYVAQFLPVNCEASVLEGYVLFTQGPDFSACVYELDHS